MEKYAIGKPAPKDISGAAVRFPWRGTGGEWLDHLLVPEGARLTWDKGKNFLVVPIWAGASLQDVADLAKRIVAKVNAWVEQQERSSQEENREGQRAHAEAQARVEELRAQLDDLNL